MYEVFEIIKINLFEQLINSLNQFDFLAQQFYANGILTSWSEIIALILSLGLLFFILFIPIKLVYKTIKRVLP